MKKVFAAVFAIALFFLVLNFGPNGLFHRENAIQKAIDEARQTAVIPPSLQSEADTASTAVASATSTAPVTTPETSPTPTDTAVVAPQIDTGTTPAPAPVATPEPAPAPAPATSPAVAEVTPAPAPAPVAAPEPAPAPQPTATVAAVETPSASEPPVVTPAPPRQRATTPPAETPLPAAEPAAPASAPAVVAAPVPAKPVKATPPRVLILGYYRFIEPGAAPGTSLNRVTAEVFDTQMAWLRDNGFEVIALSDLVSRLKSGSPLPEHAVVITVNNGFNNAITVAAPILKKYHYPWSFLIYTDLIEQSAKAASWSEMAALTKEGVEIGSQSKSHPYLADSSGKTPEQYDKWLTAELDGSRQLIERRLQTKITAFAYPYGNVSEIVQQKALSAGYDVLLSTSGDPVMAGNSPQQLGRLIINQFTAPYFATFLTQPAFRVTNVTPASGALITDPRPVITATLDYAGKIRAKSLSAELSTGGKFKVQYDPATKIVTFTPSKNLTEGPVFVLIKAKDAKTGAPFVATWQFHYKKAAQ